MAFRAVGIQADEGDLETGFRWCRVCGTRKSMTSFHRTHDRRYRRRVCSPCLVMEAAARRAGKDPRESRRAAVVRNLRRNYGLTLEMYEEMMASQDGACAICRREFGESINASPHVDHDHVSGAVRGILCFTCNTAIGKLRDDPKVLLSAIAYLTATPPALELIPKLMSPAERTKIAKERRVKGATLARRQKHSQTNRRYGVRIFSSAQEDEICRRYATGEITQAALAEEYGASRSVIHLVIKRGKVG
jgi:hypothetical protein